MFSHSSFPQTLLYELMVLIEYPTVRIREFTIYIIKAKRYQ